MYRRYKKYLLNVQRNNNESDENHRSSSQFASLSGPRKYFGRGMNRPPKPSRSRAARGDQDDATEEQALELLKESMVEEEDYDPSQLHVFVVMGASVSIWWLRFLHISMSRVRPLLEFNDRTINVHCLL